MGVNWDTSGYASEIARGSPWARTPWNSHYGVGHAHWLAAHLGRPLGLTVLGSLRALNAVALALSALIIALGATRMRLLPLPAFLLAAVYLTGWGTLILAFTWEDNLLFHPPALAVLALCLVRVADWRWRDSLAAGLLAGLASLMSWQGAAFALPAIYASLFLAPAPRAWWQRLRAKDNLEILAALVSELPEPKVIDAPPAALTWPRPLPLATPAEVAARWRGCEWASATARPRLPLK